MIELNKNILFNIKWLYLFKINDVPNPKKLICKSCFVKSFWCAWIISDIPCGAIIPLIKCFTTTGFAVRRKSEYIPCEKTGKAVPTEHIYMLFKEKGFTVPEKWSRFSSK